MLDFFFDNKVSRFFPNNKGNRTKLFYVLKHVFITYFASLVLIAWRSDKFDIGTADPGLVSVGKSDFIPDFCGLILGSVDRVGYI